MARKAKQVRRSSTVLGLVVPLEDRVVPATAIALLPNNSLVSFSTENPAAVNPPLPITVAGGLAAGRPSSASTFVRRTVCCTA